MTFDLDTTGTVYIQSAYITDRNSKVAKRWDDLSPFAQGYVAAMFAASSEDLDRQFNALWPDDVHGTNAPGVGEGPFGFSDLVPETLARAIADCERFRAIGEREGFNCADDTADHGAGFWTARNSRPWPSHPPIYERDGFPPLTVQLGDDGKVRLA